MNSIASVWNERDLSLNSEQISIYHAAKIICMLSKCESVAIRLDLIRTHTIAELDVLRSQPFQVKCACVCLICLCIGCAYTLLPWYLLPSICAIDASIFWKPIDFIHNLDFNLFNSIVIQLSASFTRHSSPLSHFLLRFFWHLIWFFHRCYWSYTQQSWKLPYFFRTRCLSKPRNMYRHFILVHGVDKSLLPQ